MTRSTRRSGFTMTGSSLGRGRATRGTLTRLPLGIVVVALVGVGSGNAWASLEPPTVQAGPSVASGSVPYGQAASLQRAPGQVGATARFHTQPQVTGSDSFICALSTSGTVSCWGDNSLGELSDGPVRSPGRYVIVPHLANVTAIAAGYSHTCALLEAKTVDCWGWNGEGQLGDGTTTNRLVPTPVTGLSGVKAIAAGE